MEKNSPRNEVVKSGVDFVFEENQVLFDIFLKHFPQEEKSDAERVYSEYLDTVFPQSSRKQIFYHGTNKVIDSPFVQDSSKIIPLSPNHKRIKVGSFFAERQAYSEEFGANVYPVLLDTNKSLRIKDLNRPRAADAIKKIDSLSQRIKSSIFGKVDSLCGNDNGTNEEVVVALSPQQIHILGSKEDQNMFDRFLENHRIAS